MSISSGSMSSCTNLVSALHFPWPRESSQLRRAPARITHRHRQIRYAGAVDKFLELILDAGVCGAFAYDYGRTLCRGDKLYGTRHGLCGRRHRGAEVDRLVEELVGIVGVHDGAETRCGDIEIYTAGTPRHCRTIGAYYCRGDVFGTVDAISRLNQRFGSGELVEALVCALHKVDRLALARTAYLYHRVAVHSGVYSSCEAVEEAERRHRKEHTGCFGKIAVGGGGHTGLLLVAEADKAYAAGLGYIGELGDGYSDKAVHGVDTHHAQGTGKNIHTCHLSGIGGGGGSGTRCICCCRHFGYEF